MMYLICEADYNPQNNGLRILQEKSDTVRFVLLKCHLGTRVEYIFKEDKIKGRKTR